ncbi:MAG TPA: dTDP-4-dehydrorhamnose 3,5-epimerase [Longimicrobiales bacterium]|nr:dTDP-4-dehydrorhamnose 3,5-epimerase [Longimicrobiales bacterium]
MIFTETPLAGAYLIDPEPIEDERGFFARAWCRRELEALGLETRVAQCSISYNRRRGTLRGMHYQAAPFEEVKVVRCIRGSIFDAIIDLRPGSPTFGRHFAVELGAEDRRALYVPRGFAHGFQALEDATEVHYQISEFHSPEHARGVRWNDPAFGIRWPIPDPVILDRDAAYPDFDGRPR